MIVPSGNGWTIGVQSYVFASGFASFALVGVDASGLRGGPQNFRLTTTKTIEAFTATPLPVIAYARPKSEAAYIDTLTTPQKTRAVRH